MAVIVAVAVAVAVAIAVVLLLEEIGLVLIMAMLQARVLLLIKELELVLKMVMVPAVALMEERGPTAPRKVVFQAPTLFLTPRTVPTMVGLKAPCMRDIPGLNFSPPTNWSCLEFLILFLHMYVLTCYKRISASVLLTAAVHPKLRRNDLDDLY
jgi:hypothetical protein